MRNLCAAIAACLLLAGTVSQPAVADDKARVQAFYDFLSNPASQGHAATLKQGLADDWKSIGDYSGRTKSRDKFLAQVAGFGKLIPDLEWTVEEILRDRNRFVVRSRASGTPKGKLFGVDGKGKGFEIMAIDIHTVENGKIVRTYHVEDWAGALRQLSGR